MGLYCAWRDSVAPKHMARLSLATSGSLQRVCQRAPAWQLGRAKACGVTLQRVAPRDMARPKGLVLGNLDLYGLLLKY